jgi:hypothetical protein
MTGCNQLRNKLEANGASGARNKNSHRVILIFVATERQVVEANVKSSRECDGGEKLYSVELTGRFDDRDLTDPNKKRRAIGAPRCFFLSGDQPFSER